MADQRRKSSFTKSRLRPSMINPAGAAILKEGELEKLSTGRVRRWQKRFFVIQGHYLKYYSDCNKIQKDLKGAIDLHVLPVEVTQGKDSKFTIISRSKLAATLRAPNVESRSEWISLLREVVSAKEANPGLKRSLSLAGKNLARNANLLEHAAAAAASKIMTVKEDFRAEGVAELSVQKGDRIKLEEEGPRDGWIEVSLDTNERDVTRNEKTNKQRGFIPWACLAGSGGSDETAQGDGEDVESESEEEVFEVDVIDEEIVTASVSSSMSSTSSMGRSKGKVSYDNARPRYLDASPHQVAARKQMEQRKQELERLQAGLSATYRQQRLDATQRSNAAAERERADMVASGREQTAVRRMAEQRERARARQSVAHRGQDVDRQRTQLQLRRQDSFRQKQASIQERQQYRDDVQRQNQQDTDSKRAFLIATGGAFS